jgi:DNA-binding NarL/FixJ family response regulator
VTPIRVYIFDEHLQVCNALTERLSQFTHIEVIGHTGEVDKILEDVKENQPDLVLLEVKRSDGMGLEILRQLSAIIRGPKVFVLTSYASNWEREAATRAGADMYMLKEIETRDLIDRISMVIQR